MIVDLLVVAAVITGVVLGAVLDRYVLCPLAHELARHGK